MTRSFSLRLIFSPPEIIYSSVVVLNKIEVLKISYIDASTSLITELLATISFLSFSFSILSLRNSMTSFFNLIFSFIKRLFVSNISNEEKLKLLLFNAGVGDKKLNFSLKYFERFFSEKISIVKIVADKRIPKI